MPPVPKGFEEAHAEWLRSNGTEMRRKFMVGYCPEFYRTTYWKLVKAAVLKRDGSVCCRCAAPANQVHHLDYRRRGEDHFYPDSLLSLCRDCHGLVEYARLAEGMMSTFRYRIARIREFLEGNARSASETPLKSLSRLLEYRDELAGYKAKFQSQIVYEGSKPVKDRKAWEIAYRGRMDGLQGSAQALLDSWNGTDHEKSARVLGMVEAEMQSCANFIAEVLSAQKSKPKPTV